MFEPKKDKDIQNVEPSHDESQPREKRDPLEDPEKWMRDELEGYRSHNLFLRQHVDYYKDMYHEVSEKYQQVADDYNRDINTFKEQLQLLTGIIEELKATGGELVTSNHELRDSNEKLKVSNAELKASHDKNLGTMAEVIRGIIAHLVKLKDEMVNVTKSLDGMRDRNIWEGVLALSEDPESVSNETLSKQIQIMQDAVLGLIKGNTSFLCSSMNATMDMIEAAQKTLNRIDERGKHKNAGYVSSDPYDHTLAGIMKRT